MRTRASLLPAVALLAATCGPTGGLDRVPEGNWGGDHVAMMVEPTGASVELDCAHGAATATLTLDAQGRFDVPGNFVPEHGGPAREDEQPDPLPARYVGSFDGHQLRFSIHLPGDATVVGPFSARQGSPPRLFKCASLLDPNPPPSS
jgi:hypothetical protein